MIVKCQKEDASYGISKASIVHNETSLIDRIEYVHKKLSSDAIIEEFIEGRELYVGILGNNRLRTFPIWELHFEKSSSPHKSSILHEQSSTKSTGIAKEYAPVRQTYLQN